ncbi:MAG: UPF0158 family protein [Synechococcales bacterium]|nr:UPF0158 family protein [Synechococcales bacterium]
MRTITIDLEELQMAFSNAMPEMTYYLDTETGEVLFDAPDLPLDVLPGADASSEERQAFEDRYLEVPPADSRKGYADMEAFIDTVEDESLRGRLEVAIQGKGAFRRFKDVLRGTPERDRWHEFRDARLQQRILAWLDDCDIQPNFEKA